MNKTYIIVGIYLYIWAMFQKMYGGVICVVGDIPASNFIGGFKEGVSFSFRKCRMCLATKDNMTTKVHYTQALS